MSARVSEREGDTKENDWLIRTNWLISIKWLGTILIG